MSGKTGAHIAMTLLFGLPLSQRMIFA